jgi:iron complex transport system ATP-binding protein
MKLEIRNISYQYVADRKVFRNVSLSLESGEILSILGANGAGKSTFLNCIAGLYQPSEGEILLDGRSLSSMSRVEIARNIGYIPQIHDSNFGFSVLEYTVMGRTPYIRPYETPSKEDYSIARACLERVGLHHMSEKIFTEMSGGEQQLAMIARVLTQQPKMIILDEPTNHLDYGNQYRTVEMMHRLSKEGYIIITSTHNPDHVLRLQGKAAILKKGGEMLVGPSETFLTEEILTELYGLKIGMVYNETAKRKLCFPCI